MFEGFCLNVSMIEAVKGFLSLLDQDGPVGDEALAKALDALALACHDTTLGTPSESGAEPPLEDYRHIRRRVEELFPDLGLYGTADPLGVSHAQALVGDAIDDISDIARDLREIFWRWRNLGPDDACWHFRLGYQAHWGRHLHELRLYLHAKQF
ncbi:hypothetical protein [Microvirga sp. M2]|uniref:hypothetical protein n=1 Tax=Microvirga sp. M2 TaxID=3073270 RepID=UPI0039C0B9D7